MVRHLFRTAALFVAAIAMLPPAFALQGSVHPQPVPYPGQAPFPMSESMSGGPFSARVQEEGRITFSSFPTLVMVPVIVTDKGGAHLHGLTAADFTVLENGKKQIVSSFE